jgi:hypothetical protein
MAHVRRYDLELFSVLKFCSVQSVNASTVCLISSLTLNTEFCREFQVATEFCQNSARWRTSMNRDLNCFEFCCINRLPCMSNPKSGFRYSDINSSKILIRITKLIQCFLNGEQQWNHEWSSYQPHATGRGWWSSAAFRSEGITQREGAIKSWQTEYLNSGWELDTTDIFSCSKGPID